MKKISVRLVTQFMMISIIGSGILGSGVVLFTHGMFS
ncbi:hypothetical protein SAMN05421578_103166 [Paenibacillus macquariensis]|uniref:Uncharacterized protein n=1 Tax=Paenibacillus macquariensis TaxID=948756 RepID=A0ABY1JR93_9BACL|nr:hypothetical protein SAMN05421578_103166 [Paenibacillus macquariensis]